MGYDKANMHSFQAILEEKIAALESENGASTDSKSQFSAAPFDLMSQLLHSTEAIFFEKGPKFSLFYNKKEQTKQPYANQAKTKPSAPEKTILLSQLTAAQKSAFDQLITLGAYELQAPDIKSSGLLGETRLKKCFRRMAKTLHPDQAQGSTPAQKAKSSQSFRELRESYNIVIGAFADKKTA